MKYATTHPEHLGNQNWRGSETTDDTNEHGSDYRIRGRRWTGVLFPPSLEKAALGTDPSVLDS